MLLLNSMGISFMDADLLITNYSAELDWLLKEIKKISSVRDIEKNLSRTKSILVGVNTGTKKGNAQYRKWHAEKINELKNRRKTKN